MKVLFGKFLIFYYFFNMLQVKLGPPTTYSKNESRRRDSLFQVIHGINRHKKGTQKKASLLYPR